jgi:hypothetical protein
MEQDNGMYWLDYCAVQLLIVNGIWGGIVKTNMNLDLKVGDKVKGEKEIEKIFY